MAFYGMVLAFLLLSSVAELNMFVNSLGYSGAINSRYDSFASLIMLKTEANLLASGENPEFLNFTSALNGILVSNTSGTYSVQYIDKSAYAVLAR